MIVALGSIHEYFSGTANSFFGFSTSHWTRHRNQRWGHASLPRSEKATGRGRLHRGASGYERNFLESFPTFTKTTCWPAVPKVTHPGLLQRRISLSYRREFHGMKNAAFAAVAPAVVDSPNRINNWESRRIRLHQGTLMRGQHHGGTHSRLSWASRVSKFESSTTRSVCAAFNPSTSSKA